MLDQQVFRGVAGLPLPDIPDVISETIEPAAKATYGLSNLGGNGFPRSGAFIADGPAHPAGNTQVRRTSPDDRDTDSGESRDSFGAHVTYAFTPNPWRAPSLDREAMPGMPSASAPE